MKVVVRKRLKHANDKRRIFTYDLALISESQEESAALDLLGDRPVGEDGLIVTGVFETRLSNGMGPHYALLKGELEHIERF